MAPYQATESVGFWMLRGDDGKIIATTRTQEGAEFLARAANAHAELAEITDEMLGRADPSEILARVRRAVALAKGEVA